MFGAPKSSWRRSMAAARTEITRRSGKAKPVVGCGAGRRGFMAEGIAGLTPRQDSRPLPAVTVQRVIDLALGPPPPRSEHWTGRRLAKAGRRELAIGAAHPELMRPRIVRSPRRHFASAPGRAMQRSHAPLAKAAPLPMAAIYCARDDRADTREASSTADQWSNFTSDVA